MCETFRNYWWNYIVSNLYEEILTTCKPFLHTLILTSESNFDRAYRAGAGMPSLRHLIMEDYYSEDKRLLQLETISLPEFGVGEPATFQGLLGWLDGMITDGNLREIRFGHVGAIFGESFLKYPRVLAATKMLDIGSDGIDHLAGARAPALEILKVECNSDFEAEDHSFLGTLDSLMELHVVELKEAFDIISNVKTKKSDFNPGRGEVCELLQ